MLPTNATFGGRSLQNDTQLKGGPSYVVLDSEGHLSQKVGIHWTTTNYDTFNALILNVKEHLC